MILDNVQYSVFIDNNTKIVSGSIGREMDDVIQGQASVYPVIAGDTLKVSNAQTLTRSTINDDTAWRDIIDGRVNYTAQGIYTVRDKTA